MEKKRLLALAIAMFSLTAVSLLVVDEGRCEGDCRIIRIQGIVSQDSLRLEPETVQISKGTCVIWFNRSTANAINFLLD